MRSPSGEKYGLLAPTVPVSGVGIEPVALPDPELVTAIARADVHEASSVGRKGEVHAEDALPHRLTGWKAHAVADDGRARAAARSQPAVPAAVEISAIAAISPRRVRRVRTGGRGRRAAPSPPSRRRSRPCRCRRGRRRSPSRCRSDRREASAGRSAPRARRPVARRAAWARSGGGCSVSTLATMAWELGPVNGGSPVSIS